MRESTCHPLKREGHSILNFRASSSRCTSSDYILLFIHLMMSLAMNSAGWKVIKVKNMEEPLSKCGRAMKNEMQVQPPTQHPELNSASRSALWGYLLPVKKSNHQIRNASPFQLAGLKHGEIICWIPQAVTDSYWNISLRFWGGSGTVHRRWPWRPFRMLFFQTSIQSRVSS